MARLTARERVEEWLEWRVRLGGDPELEVDTHDGIILSVDDIREVVEENRRLRAQVEKDVEDALRNAGPSR